MEGGLGQSFDGGNADGFRDHQRGWLRKGGKGT